MTSTSFVSNKLLYSFKVRNTLNIILDLPLEAYNKLRTIKREEANNTIVFTNIIAKKRYNSKYKPLHLDIGS